MSTEVRTTLDAGLRTSNGAIGNLLTVVTEARRLPLIPIVILMVVLIVPAIFANVISPHDPYKSPLGLAGRLEPPMWSEGGTSTHILGSDKAGRDVLTRIIHGSRVSMQISLVGIGIGGFIGILLGLVAGYYRGKVDLVIMRLVDISLSIPAVLLALSLAVALGPSLKTIVIVVAALLWAVYCRQVRGETPGNEGAGLCRPCPGGRVLRCPHHLSAYLTEPFEHPYRAGHATGGADYTSGSLPQLFGRGAEPAHSGMGVVGSRWA